MRLSIALSRGSKKETGREYFTSEFKKWNAEARTSLFSCLDYVSFNDVELEKTVIPKISTLAEKRILKKIINCSRSLRDISSPKSGFKAFYKKTGVNYWITTTDFSPKAFRDGQLSQSSREATFLAYSEQAKNLSICLLNSNLFFWFYTVFSNCRDLNPSDINDFPIPHDIEEDEIFSRLSVRLMVSLDENSEYIVRNQKQTGIIRLQSFRPSASKSIIDEIDVALAKHYQLSDEELDLIINYDIKYRAGADKFQDD